LALGKTFDKEELNIKILKSLNKTWQPKVITISKSKDLTSLNIATLFGKLREHELEIRRLNEEEDGEKKHIVALKTTAKAVAKSTVYKAEFVNDPNDYISNTETLSLMVKRFSNFLKYKNKFNNNSAGNMRHSKKQEQSTDPTCFEFGKTSQI